MSARRPSDAHVAAILADLSALFPSLAGTVTLARCVDAVMQQMPRSWYLRGESRYR